MTSNLAQLGFLLFISALVAMLTRRLHLPYTVGLVLAGMTLYFSHVYIKWHLTKDLIFFRISASTGIRSGTLYTLAGLQERVAGGHLAGDGGRRSGGSRHCSRHALCARLGLG